MWEPISFNDLYDMIIYAENNIKGEAAGFWNLIKIIPEKWPEENYGKDLRFWVVSICGYKVIWFNDIEDCFNISEYPKYGEIAEGGGQFTLEEAIDRFVARFRFGDC